MTIYSPVCLRVSAAMNRTSFSTLCATPLQCPEPIHCPFAHSANSSRLQQPYRTWRGISYTRVAESLNWTHSCVSYQQ